MPCDPVGVALGIVLARGLYCHNAFEEYTEGLLSVAIDGRNLRLETKHAPLDWQVRGRQQTRTGYGRKLTTTRMVRFPFSRRWHRVYVCCFSNSGTAYILHKGVWCTVSD